MKERNSEIDSTMSFDLAEPGGLVKLEDDEGANCLGNSFETCRLECSEENVCYTPKRTRRYRSDNSIDNDENYVPQRSKKGKMNSVDDGIDDEDYVPQRNKKGKKNSIQRNRKSFNSFSVEHSATTEENLCQSSRLRVRRDSPDIVENTAVVVVKPETFIFDDVVQSVVNKTKAGRLKINRIS